jgi:ABC-type branched-subunit amino acid transport system ATPase component
MALLETKKLTKRFSGLNAVTALDLSVNKGQILGLIGPNGSGKTTTFNLISGVLHPTSGKILFKGKDITNYQPHTIARMGIIRTFQLATVFQDLSVVDNLQVALHYKSGVGFLQMLLETPEMARRQNSLVLEKATKLLDIAGLNNLASQKAGNLSAGHQKLMSVIMALAGEPEILLLDEPMSGLNAEEIQTLIRLVKSIREERGTSIIMVEHNMKVVMEQCEYIVVINFGQKIAEGTPSQIANDKRVIEAYLGSE